MEGERAMLSEVVAAVEAYNALDTAGKTLFRGEVGLVRVQQAGGAKRKRCVAKAMVEPTQATTTRMAKAPHKGNGKDAAPKAPVSPIPQAAPIPLADSSS